MNWLNEWRYRNPWITLNQWSHSFPRDFQHFWLLMMTLCFNSILVQRNQMKWVKMSWMNDVIVSQGTFNTFEVRVKIADDDVKYKFNFDTLIDSNQMKWIDGMNDVICRDPWIYEVIVLHPKGLLTHFLTFWKKTRGKRGQKSPL